LSRLILESCTLDLHRRKIDGSPVRLTPLEWALLSYLAGQPGRAVDRDELLVEVWGYRPTIQTRAIDNTVARLRKKLEVHPKQPRHLLSIRGGGYRLMVEVVADVPSGPRLLEGVARPAEMTALTEALSRSSLVTLTGPGGGGKTWLAKRFSELPNSAFPGGVVQCSVAEAADVAAVDACVAGALGASTLPVGSALAARGRLLLIVDDAEQVVEILAKRIPLWMAAAPDFRLLVTSRVPLRLPGERHLNLPPLSAEAAVELFVLRALEAGGSPTAGVDQTALVEQLDRLPLAIELAASLAATLSESELLDQLSDRFRLLKSRSRGRPERHRALDTVISRSVQLLHPWERDALLQCATFHGGFPVDAVEPVLDVGDNWSLDVLHALQEANLVRVVKGPDGSRLSLYRSVLAWAREELADQGALADATRDRHARWFARFGEPEALGALIGSAARRRELCVERENLMAAFRWLKTSGDHECLTSVGMAVLEVMATAGPKDAAIPFAKAACDLGLKPILADSVTIRALEIGGSLLPQNELEAQIRGLLERVEQRGDALLLAAATRIHAHVLGRLSRFDEARETYALARDRCAAVGDQRGEGEALCYLGVMHRLLSQWDKALAFFQQALTIQNDLEDRVGESITRSELGALWSYRGKPRHALEHLETALQMLAEQGDRKREAVTRIHACMAHQTLGELDAARQQAAAAGVIARDLGASDMEVHIRVLVADIDGLAGRVAEAEASYLTAEAFYRERGVVLQHALTLGTRGELYLEQGALDQARTCLERAVAALQPLNHTAALGTFQGGLAMCIALLGDLDAATALIEEAAGHLANTRPNQIAVLLCRRGRIAIARGDFATAEKALAEAEAIAEGMDITDGARLARSLARLRADLPG